MAYETTTVPSNGLQQEVVIQRAADRHERPHERAYAEAHRRVVAAGDLPAVLAAAVRDLSLPRGRYIIEVGWPYE